MRLSRRFVRSGLAWVLFALAAAGPAHAGGLQILTTDAHGVTLRLEVQAPVLTPPGSDGRSRVTVPGLDSDGEPGRPGLPIASTLIALPPGAHASARVVDAGPEDVRSVRLVVLGKPGFRDDGGKLGLVPTVVPVPARADGPWPASAVDLGAPFTLRRMRVVAVRVRPLRYDEGAGTLWSRRSLTVRVDFLGGQPEPLRATAGWAGEDRHWDAVLQQVVLNFDAARAWRAPLTPAAGSALDRVRRTSAGRPLASAHPGTLGTAAFDEDNVEVRCVIDTTGVFGLTYANLSTNGFPAGIPVSQLSVHRHEFIPNASPAYVTIELPIEVDDRNNDGIFNGTDRILVFVQNWAERSRASIAQRAWGDAEVVYATYLTSRPPARLPVRSGWTGPDMTPLASYRTKQRYEKTTYYVNVFNLLPTAGSPPNTPAESDTNTDQFLWTGLGLYDRNDPSFKDVYPFETNDLDPARTSNVTVQWVGLKASVNCATGVHIAYAEVRNASNQWTAVVDSASWPGRTTETVGADLPPGALSNGRTNALRTFGRTVGSGPYLNAGLNWFDVTYARRYKAMAGQLRCNSDSAAGAFQITATGFNTRNVRVWDVTDSLAPERLSLADSLISTGSFPYTVRFQDSSPTGAIHRYVAFDFPTILPAAKFSAVTRRGLAGQGPADALILTPEAFLPAADRLAAQRQAQGLRVLECPVESVYDEFNGGRKSSHAIRRLLQYAYGTWGSKFVTLLGDGSEDPLNQMGTAGPDLIPAQRIAAPVGIPETGGCVTVYESVVSDPWYVWCLTCAPPDTQAFLHDMFIGRLPVGTPQQASDVVDKLIKYDDVRPDQTWRRRMMLLADDQYSTESFFGGNPSGTLAECYKPEEAVFLDLSQLTRFKLESEGGYQDSDIEIFDLGQFLAGIETEQDPSGRTCRKDYHGTQDYCHQYVTPVMFQHLNDGRVWWNFEGHANPYVLTHEDLYRNLGFVDDQGKFMNVDKPFLFSAFSCHPNAFGTVTEGDLLRGPSLGEDMVNLPAKGAIASWASSGYELLPPDYQLETHLTVHFARALFVDSPRDPYLGMGGARVVLGEAIETALLRNHVDHASSLEGDVGISYQLLGDPTTRLTIGAPLSVVTANAQPVTSGDPVRLRTVGDTLRLEADLVSNVRLTSIALDRTLAGATTTLPASDYTLSPVFPDSSDSSYGGRRFHLTYRATLAPDSYTFTFRTTDRYGVTGRFDAVFPFQTVLRANGATVGETEKISRNAALTLGVLSPAPLALPGGLSVTINNAPVAYTFVAASGDTSGREWTLALPHADFAEGDYRVAASAPGGATSAHQFVVEGGEDRLGIRNAYAFPNPFDDNGTTLNFRLVGATRADVQIRVYTVAGRLIYKRTEYGLLPGYHQLPWWGGDAENAGIANGMYIYRLVASNGSSSDVFEGRLIRLRRPRRAVEPTTGTSP